MYTYIVKNAMPESPKPDLMKENQVWMYVCMWIDRSTKKTQLPSSMVVCVHLLLLFYVLGTQLAM